MDEPHHRTAEASTQLAEAGLAPSEVR